MGLAESYIYYPPKVEKPVLLTDEEEFYISNIHVIHLKTPSSKYIVFSHGNASDNTGNLQLGRILKSQTGWNVILYDYPGYGLSRAEIVLDSSVVKATITEQSCCSSLKTVLDFLTNTVAEENITLMGQSLGTGVVIDYVSKYPWKEDIVLLSPFTSILGVVNKAWWGSLMQNFVDYYITIDKLPTVSCAIKYYHGTQDRVIPHSHTKTLYKKTWNKKYPVSYVEGADHNDIVHYIDFSKMFVVDK
jgi:pimeloyl-ACP methyl ester carboxylesterase